MVDFFKEDEYEPGYSIEDKVVLASVGAGGLLVVLGLVTFLSVSQRFGGIVLIIGILTGVLPYGVLSFLKNRAVKQMEKQFPEFLSDLAESKRGGMTLVRAFESATDNDYGRMNGEIERIYNELSWGIPFPEVMERFNKRLEDSAVIQESISIIIQSFKSGGDITKTIESVADDAARLRKVIQEKDAQLQQQLFIMYVIFFLFIGITIGIYTMLGQLLGLGTAESGAIEGISGVIGQESGGPTNFCNGEVLAAEPFCATSKIFGFVPANISSGEVSLSSTYATTYAYGRMAYYKALLFIMLMIQGISTAAVAGQIKEGSPSAGLKHAIIMLPIAFVAYVSYVGGAGI
ncbi:type II secretion system F family protein [Candidatus Nanosalina sp. VS9-1]|uniref:type II secretion system F family protein n=1 Tax=Candidatus Nanosalina sp. VS9-1 TaxID=3388566 RepID=UPI0039E15C07